MARNHVIAALADGATVSAIANGNGQIPAGIFVPKELTGTALTFNAYDSTGKLMGKVSDAAGAYYTRTVASGASQYVPLSRDLFSGVDQLQIISGTTQSGACSFVVVFN